MKNLYWIAYLLVIATTHAQADEWPVKPVIPLTLNEAWRLAEQNSVRLNAARGSLIAAEGQDRDTQGLLWNNPEISAERVRRKQPPSNPASATVREWGAGVSQTLEIAGQHGHRQAASAQELAAAQLLVQETEREVRAEVAKRFVQVLALQSRIAIERDSLALVENTAAFAGKRVAAGEDSRLDGNIALIEAGRARNQLTVLNDELLQARVELGEVLQWPSTTLPEASGKLELQSDVPPLDRLLTLATERAALKALQAKENAAQSRLDLERAARFPDITVGLSVAREGPEAFREKVTNFSLSLPLPLFKHNAGNVAQARAELTRTHAERRAGERDLGVTVRALWQRNQSLKTRVRTLRETVIPALEENQRLSQRALTEGEISLTQQVLVNRQLLDGRRDLLDAITELRITRIAMDLAAGTPPSGEPQ